MNLPTSPSIPPEGIDIFWGAVAELDRRSADHFNRGEHWERF